MKRLRAKFTKSTMTINSHPVYAEFPAFHFTCGGGVAIFHVKTERVVVCYHTLEHHWFLPKGRRDAGEETRRGAEREGFEEVILPSIAMRIHILTQDSPDTAIDSSLYLLSTHSRRLQNPKPLANRD
jgi:8-oxo-dGTP pyrophosphatase MutT (NUDIX family)